VDPFRIRIVWSLITVASRLRIDPANVAEGFKKRGIKDKLLLLNVAQGSAEETHYYLILAQDLGYGDTSKLREALGEVVRMLEAYCKALSKNHPGP
jgi:four helix bundle protein